MKSIEARLSKLEGNAALTKDTIVFSVFTNEAPRVKRAEAIETFIAQHHRKPSFNSVFVQINKVGLCEDL